MYCRNYYRVPAPCVYYAYPAPCYAPRPYPYVAATADEKAFTELVRHVATEEAAIEMKRQDLAYSPNFVQAAAFEAIAGCAAEEAEEGENQEAKAITAADLLAYVQKNIEGQEALDLDLARQVVADFDGRKEGRLSAAEFAPMVLPSANATARDIAQARTEAAGDCTQELAAFLLKEFAYQARLTELREALAACDTFDKDATFRRLGTRAYGIDIVNLRVFCERASCYLSTSQTDGVLRRFNHSGTGRIEWACYYELVTGQEWEKVEGDAVIEEQAPAEEEAKAGEPEASPEANFDDYDSPLPQAKEEEAGDLTRSKVKEVRIAEDKNTEAPARKLDLEEGAEDNAKAEDEKAPAALAPLPLCPYARARVLAEEDHRRRRDEYYARIKADREAAMARYEAQRAADTAAREAAAQAAEKARADWDAECERRRAAYEERLEADRQAAIKQREEYEAAVKARDEEIAARVQADRDAAEARRAAWETEAE
jgi:hypothetical protein